MPSLNILCAEDNPYGRVILNTILTEFGHRADFVGSGEAAVEAAARGGYDRVLMDVTLTGIDGLEATKRIRALPGRAGRIPVIGISALSSADDRKRATRGRDECVSRQAGDAGGAGGGHGRHRQEITRRYFAVLKYFASRIFPDIAPLRNV